MLFGRNDVITTASDHGFLVGDAIEIQGTSYTITKVSRTWFSVYPNNWIKRLWLKFQNKCLDIEYYSSHAADDWAELERAEMLDKCSELC